MRHPSAISRLDRFSHLFHRYCRPLGCTQRTDWARAHFSGFPPSLPVRTMSELCLIHKKGYFSYLEQNNNKTASCSSWYQCKSRGTQLTLKEKLKFVAQSFAVIGGHFNVCLMPHKVSTVTYSGDVAPIKSLNINLLQALTPKTDPANKVPISVRILRPQLRVFNVCYQ